MAEGIYEHEGKDYRFALGKIGERNLICVGLNPSTADSERDDQTMARVKKWAQTLGYDGCIMVNLYPQRATDPSAIHDDAHCNVTMVQRNLDCISRLFELESFDVWAAWGANAGKGENGHLLDSLSHIWRAFGERSGCPAAKWFRLGDLTAAGHPRHPLYIGYDKQPVEFDVGAYLEKMGH